MYLTPTEVAAEFQVDVRVIYDEIAKGKIRAVRVGRLLRIPERALADYVHDFMFIP